MNKLSTIVKQKRKAMGLNQKQFGNLFGVDQRTVSAIEKGETAMPRNSEKLSAVLGISTQEMSSMMAIAGIELNKTERMPSAVREKVNKIVAPDRIVDRYKSVSQEPGVSVRHVPPIGNRDVPVYGRAQGGPDGMFEFNGEIMGWETRPPNLDGVRDAYAVYVDGDSMYPRYKPGETVWINPSRPPTREDDVIVQLHPNHEGDAPFGFIKEFRAWTPTHLVVWQHNPPTEVRYLRDSVKSVHYIAYQQR